MRRATSWRFVAGAAVLVAISGSLLAQGAPQPTTREGRAGNDGQPGQRQRGQQRNGGPGFGGQGFGGMGMLRNAVEKPTFNKRDVDAAMSKLNLTSEQQDAVKALLDGYEEQAQQVAQELRNARQGAFAAMRDGGPEAVQKAWEDSAEDQKKWRGEREKLDQGFLSDVQAVLTKSQAASWDHVQRAIVRGQSMRQGLLSGERADVLTLVDQLQLADKDREALQPVLDQYELDLDRELAARDKVSTDAVNSFSPGAMFDPEKRGDLTKQMEARREAGIKVRDINNRFAKQVEALLPDAAKVQFEKSFHEASFPDIYRATQAGRALDAAEGFDDLTDDQKLAVADLHDRYNAKLNDVRPRQEQAYLETEKNFSVQGMFAGGGVGRGGQGGQGRGQGGGPAGGADDPNRALREERRGIDDKALEDLKKILSPEQTERLPEPEGPDRVRRRGGGGNGGANSPDGA